MNMRTITTLIVLLLAGASARAADKPFGKAQDKPNILLILVDDLGKEWISSYGAEGIDTPRIDELARTGMRFENAYAMPQCTPTRVTILTGQYPFRHGWTNHWDVPRWGSGAHFDASMNTSVGRVMREAGYATCAAGKWQIDDFRVEPDAMRQAGFDRSCMWTGGEAGNLGPSDERYQNPYIHIDDQPSRTHEGEFGPDIFCDFLIDFMKVHRDEPMFLYYPMVLTHTPLVPTPDEPEAKGKLTKHKAMVRYTDKLVGRLVDALDKLNLRDNTIIIFTTDNGTTGAVTGRIDGHKIRGAKANMVEAGTAVPFIVNCPGRVPSGVVTDALTDFTDLLPTFAELGGATLPKGREVDGQSMAPLLLGKENDSPRGWILSMGGHPAAFEDGRVVPKAKYDERVIRNKRFKLWIDAKRQPTKLFDMKNDPWEQHNLIGSYGYEEKTARQMLLGIIRSFPSEDAAPRYKPNPPQPWDKYEFKR